MSGVADGAKVVHSGFVRKCGQRHKSWKKRWMVLTSDGKLQYFKVYGGEPAPGQKLPTPKGQIDVRNCCLDVRSKNRSAACEWPAEAKDDRAWAIITTHRSYFMYADSAMSAAEWMHHLKESSPVVMEMLEDRTLAALVVDPRLEAYEAKIKSGVPVVQRPNADAAAGGGGAGGTPPSDGKAAVAAPLMSSEDGGVDVVLAPPRPAAGAGEATSAPVYAVLSRGDGDSDGSSSGMPGGNPPKARGKYAHLDLPSPDGTEGSPGSLVPEKLVPRTSYSQVILPGMPGYDEMMANLALGAPERPAGYDTVCTFRSEPNPDIPPRKESVPVLGDEWADSSSEEEESEEYTL